MRAAFGLLTVAGHYERQIILAAAWLTLIVLACVEWVFLSELLISHLLPRVLEVNAGWAELAELIVFSVPDGIAIALPLALAIGAYLVVLRRREAGELIALAGIGEGGRFLIKLAVQMGLLGAAASLLISAHLAPLASHAAAKSYDDARFEALREGNLPSGRFYQVADLYVFAAAGRFGAEAGGVFVYQTLELNQHRVVTSPKVVRLTLSANAPGLLLEDAKLLDFASATVDSSSERALLLPRQIIEANRHVVGVPELEPEPPASRLEQLRYVTLAELLALGVNTPERLTTSVRHLLHALLCALAPMLAVLAVAWTSRRSVIVALPAASGCLLGVTFFLRELADVIAAFGTIAAGAALLSVGVAVAIAAMSGIFLRETRCLVPVGVRL